MVGSAEERLDALNREIADLELKRDAHVSIIAALTDQGLDTAAAKAVLQRIEDQLAALRVRTAPSRVTRDTFERAHAMLEQDASRTVSALRRPATHGAVTGWCASQLECTHAY